MLRGEEEHGKGAVWGAWDTWTDEMTMQIYSLLRYDVQQNKTKAPVGGRPDVRARRAYIGRETCVRGHEACVCGRDARMGKKI